MAEATLRVIAAVQARTPGGVAAGGAHTCAPMQDGSIRCWGANDRGQLGDSTRIDRLRPVVVPFATARVYVSNYSGQAVVNPAGGQIEAGDNFTCTTSGAIVRALSIMNTSCWGAGDLGQLGDGTRQDRARVPARPIEFADDGVVQVGERHACFDVRSGGVACWGDDSHGQLGDGATATSSATPVGPNTAGLFPAPGGDHTCAMAGSVICWGANAHGQLGDGTTIDRTAPVSVTLGQPAEELAAGHAHTCARLVDGTVACWGANGHGQLGSGTTADRTAPVVVPGLEGVTRLDARGDNTCALGSDGRLRCWGANDHGQLGDGTTTDRTTPTLVEGLSGVRWFSVGAHHVCVVTARSGLWCWGANDRGQLGDGTTVDRHAPVAVRF